MPFALYTDILGYKNVTRSLPQHVVSEAFKERAESRRGRENSQVAHILLVKTITSWPVYFYFKIRVNDPWMGLI